MGPPLPSARGAIGLTGGIATGKSTVARLLAEKGAAVIDADVLAREAVAKGTPASKQIAARFPGVVGPDGELDRQALGARIFGNEGERTALNQIVHPEVQRLAFERLLEALEGPAPLVVYDVPLLFENRLESMFHGVLVVDAAPAVQRARLVARNGLSEAEAQARIDSQLPMAEKRARATWVVDNGGTLEATGRAVNALWPTLLATANQERT